jgi:hypothetical protein
MIPEWTSQGPEPNSLSFPDEYPETSKLYGHWIYFRTLHILTTADPTSTSVDLTRTNVPGEKLIDDIFKNTVIDTLVAVSTKTNWNPVRECLNISYEGTSEGSPARKLAVDARARWAHESPS